MFKYVKTSLYLAAVCAVTIIATACGAGSGASGGMPMAEQSPAAAPQSSAASVEYSVDAEAMDVKVEEGLGGELASTAAEDAAVEEGGAAKPPENIRDDRKIVWRAGMSLETLEFDNALVQLEQMIKEKGGYIETQSVDSGSMSYKYYERSASITARIPSDKLDSFADGVSVVCNVVSRSKSSEDITDSYFDATARLKTLKIQEERLLEILKKAEKLEDVITLETALSNVRYEIESLTAAIRRMDSQTAFSYMDLTLREVAKFKEATEAPKTFGQELSAAAARSGRHLADTVRVLTLVLVECLPVLLFWAIVIFAIALAVRAVLRRLRANDRKKYAPKAAIPHTLPENPAENMPGDDKK